MTIAFLLYARAADAQSTTSSTADNAPTPTSDAPMKGAADDGAELPQDEAQWAISFSAFTYIVPDDSDYVQPTLTLDRDWLHLEARYNYEDLDTASIWLGYNFSCGDELRVDFTPMIGGVFGDTRGVAPGYKLTLAWRNFELYTEGEYLFDTDESSDSFFYTWSELTYSFTDWLYAGVVVQRTKVYETDFDIQRGLIAGVSHEWLDLSAAVLNPDDGDPLVILGVEVSVEF
jgi:hypothetical protein